MEVKINKFDHFGRGISKIDNKIIFIDKALPNEIVDVEITKEKKHYYEGKIKKISTSSTKREEAICPYYYECGGCQFLHTTYDVEKDFKKEKAKELLGSIDQFYETKKLNYRNKVTLHVNNEKLGFYQEKTNNIVDVNYCYLLDDNINKVIKDLKNLDLLKYHLQDIIIKTNQNNLLLAISGEIDNAFIDHFSYVDTIICNKKVVKGKGYIEETIAGKIFKITPNAFFQVNKEGLENIYEIIKNNLRNKKLNKLLDLYSGTSLWSILLSDYFKDIISIEINREACIDAKDNLKKNNIHNIKIINGDVKDYLKDFINIDVVIVDPPRSGLDKKTREYLKTIGSKYIIYISCDMQTLKRDIDVLKEEYNINSINLVDMFRGTYHCECVLLLCRKTFDK